MDFTLAFKVHSFVIMAIFLEAQMFLRVMKAALVLPSLTGSEVSAALFIHNAAKIGKRVDFSEGSPSTDCGMLVAVLVVVRLAFPQLSLSLVARNLLSSLVVLYCICGDHVIRKFQVFELCQEGPLNPIVPSHCCGFHGQVYISAGTRRLYKKKYSYSETGMTAPNCNNETLG